MALIHLQELPSKQQAFQMTEQHALSSGKISGILQKLKIVKFDWYKQLVLMK